MPLKISAKTANNIGPQKVNGRREAVNTESTFFSGERLLPELALERAGVSGVFSMLMPMIL
jgi:hypothetical protein